ncbi:MAG TPA: tetratricopeptide repeat protein, partial [Dehalococcoidia bacterium]|nr:tetratricopeptide repeat protein [Dehalococcoidia bacterium]
MAGEEAKKFLEEGNRLYKEGKYQEALESFDKALAFDPRLAAAWYNRGNALAKLGEYQEAVESYDKA